MGEQSPQQTAHLLQLLLLHNSAPCLATPSCGEAAHSRLPARKGLEVGKGGGNRGIEGPPAESLCSGTPAFELEVWREHIHLALPTLQLLPCCLPLSPEGFPTTSCCHCPNLYSQSFCSFFPTLSLAAGNYIQPSCQLWLSKSYYFSKTNPHRV